jgi:hypothetical protein
LSPLAQCLEKDLLAGRDFQIIGNLGWWDRRGETGAGARDEVDEKQAQHLHSLRRTCNHGLSNGILYLPERQRGIALLKEESDG